MSRTRLLFFVVALISLLGVTAYANSLDEAKRHFSVAVDQVSKGNYNGALAEFEGSYRLNPMPEVLHNIALVQKLMGRNSDALAAFEKYLTDAAFAGRPGRRAEVERLIVDLKSKLAAVNLNINAPTPTARLDGRPVSPLGTFWLNPGAHLVEVAADGYLTARKEVIASAGRAYTLSLVLAPDPAAIAPVQRVRPQVAAVPAQPAPAAQVAQPAPPLAAQPLPATSLTLSHASSPTSDRWVSRKASKAALVLGALSVASFAVAAGTGATALSKRQVYDRGCDANMCNQGDFASGIGLARTSDAFIGVGVIAAVGTTIAAILSRRPSRRPVMTAPVIGGSF